jgi:hypothetical protein
MEHGTNHETWVAAVWQAERDRQEREIDDLRAWRDALAGRARKAYDAQCHGS